MTTENNKIIAEFMGMKPINKNEADGIWNCTIKAHGYNIVQNLSFHNDWNWLMEVVDKIEQLNVTVEIYPNKCIIRDYPKKFFDKVAETKIQAIYNACVEFIKWYNKQGVK